MSTPGHNGGPPLEEDNGVDPEVQEMDLQALLREGQKALLVSLVSKLRKGIATHQEQAILRNMLRDNGMMLPPASTAPEAEEPADLPDFEDPDYR